MSLSVSPNLNRPNHASGPAAAVPRRADQGPAVASGDGVRPPDMAPDRPAAPVSEADLSSRDAGRRTWLGAITDLVAGAPRDVNAIVSWLAERLLPRERAEAPRAAAGDRRSVGTAATREAGGVATPSAAAETAASAGASSSAAASSTGASSTGASATGSAPSSAPSAADPASAAAATPDAAAFESRIGELLSADADGNVHEEELFAAIAYERIHATAGEAAAARFVEVLQQRAGELAREDGYVPIEQAAVESLRSLRDLEVLSPDAADRVYAEAFAAAQLDAEADALYDGRGEAGDPTIATGSWERAISSAWERVAAFQGGEAAPARSLDEANPAGDVDRTRSPAATSEVDGTGGVDRSAESERGFLFKPSSERDGNLVILLPPGLADRVSSLVLREADGTETRGEFSAIANGGRPHFRFDRAGGEFVGPVVVEARLDDGTVREWRVADPSQRME